MLNSYPMTSSVKLFNKLYQIPFYEEANIKKCIIGYKRLYNITSPYIFSSFKLNDLVRSCNTRYRNFNFISPKSKRIAERGKSFSVATVKLKQNIA